MSKLQVDDIVNKNDTGSVGFSRGAVVTGIVTATGGSFSGNVSVGGTLTYEDVTNIDSVGIITAQSDVVIADKIIHLGDTNTAIRFPANDTFTVETAGSERLRIASNGRVGILTVTPEARLDVYDTSSLGILSRSASTQATDSNKALKVRNNSSTDTFNVSYKGQGYFSGPLLIGTTTAGSGQLTVASTSHTGITIRSGSTSSNSNIIFADAASGADVGVIQYKHSDDSLRIVVNNGERLRILSGGGLTFNGDSAAANALDDYEEGTFTPTAFVGTTALSVSGNTGTYTKIGNTVFFSCRLDSITKSGTGEFSIGGLPYTPLFTGNANKYNQPTVRYTNINPGGVLVPLFSPTGSRFIFFQAISTSGSLSGVTNTNLNSTCSIYGLSGFYTV